MNAEDVPEGFGLVARVGKRDIEKGCQGDTSNCPVARAIIRSLVKLFPGQDITVSVMEPHAFVDFILQRSDDGYIKEFVTYMAVAPQRLTKFVCSFDSDGPAWVNPTSFTLHFSRLGW